jgi:hypothetical protein
VFLNRDREGAESPAASIVALQLLTKTPEGGSLDVSRSHSRSFSSICTVLVDALVVAKRRRGVESRHRGVIFVHCDLSTRQRSGANVNVSRKIASAASPKATRFLSSLVLSKITGWRRAKKNSRAAQTSQLQT